MYMSKILISGTACRNPYEIHRALWKLFPEDAEAARDFLFRVERSEGNQAEILMQSNREPVFTYKEASVIASRKYHLSVSTGQRLRFMLVANPVKMIDDEKGRRNVRGDLKKCRVPLIREGDQRAWIERKCHAAATFDSLAIDPIFPLRFKRNKEDHAGKIQPVAFLGILKIENPGALAGLVQRGVGPAKAFGCGLLSLARA